MENKQVSCYRQCKCDGCNKKSCYNKIGEINPKYCYEHRSKGMINVFNSFRFH